MDIHAASPAAPHAAPHTTTHPPPHATPHTAPRRAPQAPADTARPSAPRATGLDAAARRIGALLERAGLELNGPHDWDPQFHDAAVFQRILVNGSLGLGDSYVDGQWDCARLDECFARILRAGLDEQVGWRSRALPWLRAHLLNGQTVQRARRVGEVHYDLEAELFEPMLGPTMAYSCGYWAQARHLDEAQRDKLDLVCRKLGLSRGMTLLDIGCGWGSLLRHAAEHYGAHVTGLTISKEQAHWAQQRLRELPVQVNLMDYRRFNANGAQRFDRVASIGMFEHVGHRNHRDFFDAVQRSLAPNGLALLHTIGKNRTGGVTDPWIERHIFPNGALPSPGELAQAAERQFVIEDWHSFGADYDRTLMAWHANFERAWPHLAQRRDERFRRLWRYYLLSCAGAFRARSNQLWQLVLSPAGVRGGYRRAS